MDNYPMTATATPKLIEIDLPLEAISAASIGESASTKGHPSRIHKYWARRPLATCRSIIFASMVDDPSGLHKEFPTEAEQNAERQRLHDLLIALARWKPGDNQKVLEQAHIEIARSVSRSATVKFRPGYDNPITYLGRYATLIQDPFAGGATIPLEAQRLGLAAIGTDLNPMAVIINKALTEIPVRYHNHHPVNPYAARYLARTHATYKGNAGLVEDILYYGMQVGDLAKDRIEHLYPSIAMPSGSKAQTIGWLWVRTVPCRNPACCARIPLMRDYAISTDAKHRQWAKPVIDMERQTISFQVQDHKEGIPTTPAINAKQKWAQCLVCRSRVDIAYVRQQGAEGNITHQMVAVYALDGNWKTLLTPTDEHIAVAESAAPSAYPDGTVPKGSEALGFRINAYGFTKWSRMFTCRQLVALSTISGLIRNVWKQVAADGNDPDYATAIVTYLALAFGRTVDHHSTFCRWRPNDRTAANTMSRPLLQMMWDFIEVNPFGPQLGTWKAQVENVADVVASLPVPANLAVVYQADAVQPDQHTTGPVIVTDPPYYDSIGYADLSDFFYIWLRPLLRDHYPEILGTMRTPKQNEIIAGMRFGNPNQHFEDNMRLALRAIRERSSPDYPSSIFYAYKQQDVKRDGIASTGWETMLKALISEGFQIVGTWPIRTDKPNRMRALKSNALSSTVVLVCRLRPDNAPNAIRQEFITALETEMPLQLDYLTGKAEAENHILPADLRQAAIGPGMAIYSRYNSIQTLDGQSVTVQDALRLINNTVARYLDRQISDLEPETRFCIEWLQAYQNEEGLYQAAENMALTYSISVADRLDREHGLLTAQQGNVKLHSLDNYDESNNPIKPNRQFTTWEACHRIAWHLTTGDNRGGLAGAVAIARQTSDHWESILTLAHRLYDIHSNQGDSYQAVAFNSVVASWDAIIKGVVSSPERRLV